MNHNKSSDYFLSQNLSLRYLSSQFAYTILMKLSPRCSFFSILISTFSGNHLNTIAMCGRSLLLHPYQPKTPYCWVNGKLLISINNDGITMTLYQSIIQYVYFESLTLTRIIANFMIAFHFNHLHLKPILQSVQSLYLAQHTHVHVNFPSLT